MTKRVIVTVTDDMHTALKAEAAQRGAAMSSVVRIALAEWLAERDYSGDWTVQYGARPESEDERQAA